MSLAKRMKRSALIEVQSVAKIYESKSLHVLRDLTFDVREGELLSIVGPSGCGKTTLLEILCGVQHPTHGRVLFRGDAVERARRDRRIGFVPQKYTLLPWLTVLQNITLPLRIAGLPAAGTHEAQALIDRFGLDGFENYLPSQLSGGMQQRVAIARAIVYEPTLLLMDEPFGALDEPTRNTMDEFLLDLWHRTDTTIVFVTHNISEAVYLSDRILVLSPLEKGLPAQLERIVNLDLPRPRTPAVRETREYFQLLREAGAW